jgi:hypothetical protein
MVNKQHNYVNDKHKVENVFQIELRRLIFQLTFSGKLGSFIPELPVSSPAFGDFAGLLPH